MATTPNVPRLKKMIKQVSPLNTNGITAEGTVTVDTGDATATSGSALILRGTDESIFVHMGGNQYITNNAYFEGGFWVQEQEDKPVVQIGYFAQNKNFIINVTSSISASSPTLNKANRFVMHSSGSGQIGLNIGSPAAIPNAQLHVNTDGSNNALSVTGSVDLNGNPSESYYFKMPTVPDATTISSPANGMMVYDANTDKIAVYVNGSWVAMATTTL